MKIGRLESRLKARKRHLRHQENRWEKTHVRGHAKAAKREAEAVRFLKGLISKEERRRRKMLPKVMFDDTSVELIPPDAKAVACYTNGAYKNCAEVHVKFPHAHKVTIDVANSNPAADFLDIERGDATIEDAPGWFREHQKRRPGTRPGFYISISEAQALESVLRAHGIKRREYKLWTAHYTFHPHVCGPKTCGYPSKADGTQYTNWSHEHSLDQSLLKESFWE